MRHVDYMMWRMMGRRLGDRLRLHDVGGPQEHVTLVTWRWLHEVDSMTGNHN